MPRPSNTEIKTRPRGVFNKRPTPLVPIEEVAILVSVESQSLVSPLLNYTPYSYVYMSKSPIQPTTAHRLSTDVEVIDIADVNKTDPIISPDDIIVDTDTNEYDIYPEYESPAKVLGTIYKKRHKNVFKRATRKFGKMLGIIPKYKIYSDLDLNLELFRGTCLENIKLTDIDYAIIKAWLTIMAYDEERERILVQSQKYCEYRDLILKKDPDFMAKYPSITTNVLY